MSLPCFLAGRLAGIPGTRDSRNMCKCSCGRQVLELVDRLGKLEQRVKQLEADNGYREMGTCTNRGKSGSPKVTAAACASEAKAAEPEVLGPGAVPRSPMPAEVPMSSTRVVMQQLCRPLDCDRLGVCFGGTVMSWVDLSAGLASKMAARGPCVTASLDAVHFVRPLKINTIAIIDAMVNCVFSSSMEVGVRVFEEDPGTGERSECCHAFLTFVSLRSLKRPDNPDAKPLPRLVAQSPEEEALQRGATTRREERLAKRDASQKGAKKVPHLSPRHYREIVVPDTSVLRRSAGAGNVHNLSVRPEATLSHTFQRVLPPHANTMGITFGGQVLSWVEQAAYLSAIRLNLSGHMLTAALDDVTFKEPTRVGDILYFTSVVTAVFKSSVEVMVSVYGEHPFEEQHETFFVVDAFVTLVSVGLHGEPQMLAISLEPTTEAEVSRMEAAKHRRLKRLELRRLFVQQALIAVKAINAIEHCDPHGGRESCSIQTDPDHLVPFPSDLSPCDINGS